MRDAMALRRGLVLPVSGLLLWAAWAHLSHARHPLLVAPERVALVPFLDPEGVALWPALWASLARMMIGFAVGTLIGGLLGFAMALSRTTDRAVGPTFTAVRQITLFAWIPLLTAWFGNSETAKLVFIAISAGLPVAFNAYRGLVAIPRAYQDLARVLRLSPLRRFRRLLLPAALPALFVGLEVALINAWIGTVGAEYEMGMGSGLGVYLSAARDQFRMDIVIAGVATLAATGFVFNIGLRALHRRVTPWANRA